MTKYNDTFGSDTTGAQPAGWTEQWDGANSTWAVQVAAEVPTGKLLRHTATANGKRLLSWDTLDADANRATVEVLFKFKSSSTSGSQGLAAVRGSGAAGAENGYWITQTSTQIQLRKYVAGVDSQIAAASFAFTANTRYYVRFQANGTALKVKIWAVTATEPGTWNIDTTDASIAAAGWIGFAASTSTGNKDWDFISVGTNGDTADFLGTDVRGTQEPVLVLDATPSTLRSTQEVVLVLHNDSPTARVTQEVALVLVSDLPAVKLTQEVVLALVHETPCLQQLAQCWKITRVDGSVFRFTTHDQPVVMLGQTYLPCESLQASAVSGGMVSGGVGDVQANGLISDTSITERELLGGLFDGAVVEVWEMQWGNVETGFIPRRLAKGIMGKISQGDISYKSEILTPGARLQQRPLLRPHTPACRYDLGDGRCPVALGPLTVTGSVTAMSSKNVLQRTDYRMFQDTARVEADGYFNDGKITWTSGFNIGLGAEIRANAAGWFTLWAPMPYKIEVGDSYTMTPGCAKTKDDHTAKFGLDMVDFGGFPDLPGNDAILKTPDAKS